MKAAGHLKKHLLLLCIALCIALTTRAQRYPFFNIGIEEGLLQSQVMGLAQDAAGHLWIGTLGGLSCYDGRSFRAFTVRDGLPSNTITALATDSAQGLWVCTGRGLCLYDGHHFRRMPLTDTGSASREVVMQLAVSADKTVWCIAARSLFRIRAGRATMVALPQGCKSLSAICADGSGGLWMACPEMNSLYRLSEKGYDSIALPLSPKPLRVYRIYKDAAQRLILLTQAGAYRLDGASWTMLIPRGKATEPLLYSFAAARDGSYWFGSSVGALRYSNGQVAHYNKANGLTDLNISETIADREGNIWLGSNGEGLYRFSGAAFTSVDERMGLSGPQVSSIAHDAAGTVYFGSYDGGLYRYAQGKISSIPLPEGNARRPVSALLIRGSVLWIAAQGAGLWQYSLKNGTLRRARQELKGPGITAMLPVGEDGLLAVAPNGIYKLSGDSLQPLRLPQLPIDAAVFIGRDSLLIATPEGLLLNNGHSTVSFKTGSAADSGQIVCMDYRAGTVWMGTSDNGVIGYNLRSRHAIHIGRSEGLRSQFIYNIYATADGYVWVGTGYGICRIRPDEPHPQVHFFGRSAGLVGMESNRNAVLPLADGSIWFGTTGGAVLYHPDEAVAAPAPISLQMERVTLFGEPIRDTSWYKGTTDLYGVPQQLRLPWRQNNLSFSFAAISLSGVEDITYRYRLEGLQAPWSEWSSNATVTFSALPPGHYTLQVQSSTDGIHAQPQMLSYPFEIITPFHKTAWFKLLILGGCIALGIALQYIAAWRKRRRHALLERLRREEQARVRQRTAEDFHDEVGNKITRINVLTNVLRSKIGLPAPPELSRLIDGIQDNASQLYGGTRDILWSLQPANDTLYQVLNRIRDFGQDLFGDTEISFEMEGIDEAWKDYRLPMDKSRNLIMIFKEALNNALKYAMADEVRIIASTADNVLHISLTDDGKGFDESHARSGQGMSNMKNRATRLGGKLGIKSTPGKGTSLLLTMPLR